MIARAAIVVAVLALGAFALRHPATGPAFVAASASPGPLATAPRHGPRLGARTGELVVYVAGAVRAPGLYRLQAGDRAAKAVALAGGFGAAADAAGVNLAQRPGDGDEIYVPLAGEAHHARAPAHGRRRPATPPPDGSVDVNRAAPAELAAVPGIGRAVAARIVELREREGSFTSLDELLDVAGMTASRLERARPYLATP
jgi:competence protein ComEA